MKEPLNVATLCLHIIIFKKKNIKQSNVMDLAQSYVGMKR